MDHYYIHTDRTWWKASDFDESSGHVKLQCRFTEQHKLPNYVAGTTNLCPTPVIVIIDKENILRIGHVPNANPDFSALNPSEQLHFSPDKG